MIDCTRICIVDLMLGELAADCIYHCACGAARPAPAGISMISCIRCGRAMAIRTSATDDKPAPSRPVLAGATLVSQLLGVIVFAFALLWFVRLGERGAVTVAIMIAGAIAVFAGGNAHRGSIIGVIACVAFDIAVAVACFAVPEAVVFVARPMAWLAPSMVTHVATAIIVIGAAGVIAGVACMLALPQARRFGAWRDAQIMRAARVSRG